jgi:hypothetical protein
LANDVGFGIFPDIHRATASAVKQETPAQAAGPAFHDMADTHDTAVVMVITEPG